MADSHRYCDFDFSFERNPLNGDVAKKVDKNAIRQSIRNLVLMRKYAIPFKPKISSQIPEQLFSVITPATKNILQRAITYTLENFEPRIQIEDVIVDTDLEKNAINITVTYTIINTGQSDTYNFKIIKTR